MLALARLRSQHPLSVETNFPTPEEFLTQPGQIGHDGQYAGQKIFMHVYHVCGLMLCSEVHERTGERSMACLALILHKRCCKCEGVEAD